MACSPSFLSRQTHNTLNPKEHEMQSKNTGDEFLVKNGIYKTGEDGKLEQGTERCGNCGASHLYRTLQMRCGVCVDAQKDIILEVCDTCGGRPELEKKMRAHDAEF